MTLLISIFVPLQSFAQVQQINTTNSYPPDSAQAWLAKMSEAVKSLN